MPSIPLLPTALQDIPTAPDAWMLWRDDIITYRALLHDHAAKDPDLQVAIHRQCEQDPAYFIALFCWIYEPRARGGRGGNHPFVPFAFQVDLLRWIMDCMEREDSLGDGVVSKARDMGVSWMFCAWAVWGWMFRSPFHGLLVSRNASLVDAATPKSLFYKIDRIVDQLPEWLRPEHSRLRAPLPVLEHQGNGNTLTGESTTRKAGRGDRVSFILYDEAAFIPDFLATWSSGSNSTDHRFAVSSESLEEGWDFNQLQSGQEGRRPALFPIDWHLSPYHDEAWYIDMEQRMAARPAAFQNEVLRNPVAGFGEWVYEETQRMDVGDFPYIPGAPLYCTMDPGRKDDTAILWVQHNPLTGRYRVVESYSSNRETAEYYATILTGTPSSEFDYDENAEDVMEWTAALPGATYVGDPHGSHQEVSTGESFYDNLNRKARQLTGRGIVVRRSWKMETRRYRGRREAMRWLLSRLDWNDTPRVRHALEAFQRNRFQSVRDGKESTNEPEKPVHDWTSHYVSSGEFLAVNLREMRGLAPRKSRPPRRIGMGGKLIGSQPTLRPRPRAS